MENYIHLFIYIYIYLRRRPQVRVWGSIAGPKDSPVLGHGWEGCCAGYFVLRQMCVHHGLFLFPGSTSTPSALLWFGTEVTAPSALVAPKPPKS